MLWVSQSILASNTRLKMMRLRGPAIRRKCSEPTERSAEW